MKTHQVDPFEKSCSKICMVCAWHLVPSTGETIGNVKTPQAHTVLLYVKIVFGRMNMFLVPETGWSMKNAPSCS